jgi:hypothetical protein
VLAHEAEKRLRARGIEVTRPVPPKVAIPLIEAAAIEDEPDLMALWAELLANAMDPDRPKVPRRLVSILEELTADDAAALAKLFSEWPEVKDAELLYDAGGVEYRPGVDAEKLPAISVASLNRLGLISPAEMVFHVPTAGRGYIDGMNGVQMGEQVVVPGDPRVVRLTELGEEFCRAVGLAQHE